MSKRIRIFGSTRDPSDPETVEGITIEDIEAVLREMAGAGLVHDSGKRVPDPETGESMIVWARTEH
jgi:hypothetical protein